MAYQLPLKIDNGHGEIITFTKLLSEPDGDRLLFQGHVQPGGGPIMHVHHKQDEHFHVVQGTMAYETPGQPVAYLIAGQSVTFRRNEPHKFWNSGDDELLLDSWAKPAHNLIFYLSTLYESTRSQKMQKLDPFVAAFIIRRYSSEYSLLNLSFLTRTVVIPLTYATGCLLGKYRRFADAPDPM